jgi:hypothetical protein
VDRSSAARGGGVGRRPSRRVSNIKGALQSFGMVAGSPSPGKDSPDAVLQQLHSERAAAVAATAASAALIRGAAAAVAAAASAIRHSIVSPLAIGPSHPHLPPLDALGVTSL